MFKCILLRIILLFLLAQNYHIIIYAQSNSIVTLEGKQFKLNGANFYPVTLNYGIEISSPSPGASTWQTSGYISPFVEYGPNQFWDCNNESNCDNLLQRDFNYIAGMGFNSIRVAFSPSYDKNNNRLFWQGRDNPVRDFFQIPLYPNTPNDPGTLFVLSCYEKIMEVANNTINVNTSEPQPLKIIFLMSGNHSDYGNYERNAYTDFFKRLAVYISSSTNKNAVFAYDLMNEPCYCVEPKKTKAEACEMISAWYNAFKQYDPEHLITIGSCGVSDIFSFDPGILKVDFISEHHYPAWAIYEERTEPAMQERARTRTVNNLHWMNNACPFPWIIGETGFTASATQPISQGIDGTVSDQSLYANTALYSTCNCGGSGFSWWSFQDTYYYDPNDINTIGRQYYGLLEREYGPCHDAEKPAVSIFRNYTPGITGSCPVDYNPTFDASKLYYDPYQNSQMNTAMTNAVSGYIYDTDNHPVKNAFILALNWLYREPQTQKYIHSWIYTFSDENGYFKVIPYNYKYYGDNKIIHIEGSASGAESFCRDSPPPYWANNQMNPANVGTIYIRKSSFQNKTNVTGINVASGNTENFKGGMSLIIDNSNISGISDFTARQEVQINTEFNASYGSEVHIYTSATFADCSDFSTFVPKSVKNILSTGNSTLNNSREIELQFNKIENELDAIIIPNPNNGIFTVKLNFEIMDEPMILKIKNLPGKSLREIKASGKSFTIDCSNFCKGIYLLEVNIGEKMITKKLIIN